MKHAFGMGIAVELGGQSSGFRKGGYMIRKEHDPEH